MKVMRKIIEIDEEACDGCGDCILSCDERAIQIVDGKAKVVKEMYCDGLGACLGECPQGALKLVEREAEEFDENAVEAHLATLAETEETEETEKGPAACGCGCPSETLETFPGESKSCQSAAVQPKISSSHSSLGHWPVQIRLIPPHAPFLKNADLVVAADCVPVALPSFHSDFLKDRAVMIGCPKFDDKEEYTNRFTEMFKTAGIKSVTVLIMEVPCCSGLPGIVKKAMERAKQDIPLREVVVSARGEIVS
ncbi:MAG: 4Fe-4S ferredoxin [Desulfobacteraceae bacterium]